MPFLASGGEEGAQVEAEVSRLLLEHQKQLEESTDQKFKAVRDARQQLPAFAARANVR